MTASPVRRQETLTPGQRAGLHAAARHPHGYLPPSVVVRDLVGLVGLGLAEPLERQPDGAHTRSPRCRITARGVRRVAREPRPRLILVPCSATKSPVPAAEVHEMYRGSYHRAARRAAQALVTGTDAQVLVISAKFGLLRDDDRILHYDLRAGQHGTVTGEVLRRQAHHLSVSGAQVTVLAGKTYAALARGAWRDLHHPLSHARGIGDHLAFFASLYGPGRRTAAPGH
ncbi:DUF6884 domain-containing protein [Streptomyces sp. NPDC014983]|uniref:DUF6884 domain-containing protein n=1 Tax=Streptomyces sp. NPDC014983 TaxID=3364933 RepID=UPI00370250FA